MTEKPTYDELVARIKYLEREAIQHKIIKDQSAETTSVLKATLESTADGIVVVNRAGRIVNFNRRFLKLCDIPQKLMTSQDDNQVLAHILKLVRDPEIFLEKTGQIYAHPEVENHDIVEFKDGRIFERVSLPQILEGKTVGRVWSFRDITDFVRSESRLRQTLETLRKALGGTIQAVAMTVEKRDPYTAGHQRRVADLSRAIATAMGLPKDTINGIRLAGSIHDLGKTSVPTDILSKPGRLTEHEFGIIKTHPEIGHEILKDIQFPWPIAETILQHHERLDGSGYPRGLKDREILLESKIIAVADVVEALSSHRPYRPSMGLENALAEISNGRGQLYDAKVVDVCHQLVSTGKFKFKKSYWHNYAN
ncbi:HD-GYP domain-containing protein [Desulforhopalus singaporensis]|nr:HD domain-containing phosphohydrolase [Desulforhopalus singaporensis]